MLNRMLARSFRALLTDRETSVDSTVVCWLEITRKHRYFLYFEPDHARLETCDLFGIGLALPVVKFEYANPAFPENLLRRVLPHHNKRKAMKRWKRELNKHTGVATQ
jgi:hypothetical protein